jgi:hypothetical protein
MNAAFPPGHNQPCAQLPVCTQLPSPLYLPLDKAERGRPRQSTRGRGKLHKHWSASYTTVFPLLPNSLLKCTVAATRNCQAAPASEHQETKPMAQWKDPWEERSPRDNYQGARRQPTQGSCRPKQLQPMMPHAVCAYFLVLVSFGSSRLQLEAAVVRRVQSFEYWTLLNVFSTSWYVKN